MPRCPCFCAVLISTVAFASYPLCAADALAASSSVNSPTAVAEPVASGPAVAEALTATPTADELMAMNTEFEILLINADPRIKDIFDGHPTWAPLYALMFPGLAPLAPIGALDSRYHFLHLNNLPNGVILNPGNGAYITGGVSGCGYCNDP
jgi:hypothetical protein